MITLGMLGACDDATLKRVWSWQTRVGIAPKFGSMPIGWYQCSQCKTSEHILNLAKEKGLFGEVEDNERRVYASGDWLWVTTGEKPVRLCLKRELNF